MLRTANYDLCQYEGSDKTSYLINYNGDMLKIDTAIKGAKDAADNAQATANGADAKADANAASIQTLDTEINGQSGIAADLSSVQGSVNTINSLIGTGEPTTAQKTLIGAINELDAENGNLAELETTNKSSLVAAINEANARVTNSIFTVSQVDLASVTADGVKTLATLLNELAAAFNAFLATLDDEKVFIYHVFDNSTSRLIDVRYFEGISYKKDRLLSADQLSSVHVTSTSSVMDSIRLATSNSHANSVVFDSNGATYTSKDSEVPADGVVIKIQGFVG